MKKILVLCAACALFFACGNSNPGVDILDNALEAAKDGDFEKAWDYMQEYEEWEANLTPEELEKYGDALDVWYEKHEDELVESMENYYEDSMDAISDKAEELVEGVEDWAEDVADEAEKALEDAAKALESLFE